MIEIGPNLLVAIQATCARVGASVLAYFMYRLVRDC